MENKKILLIPLLSLCFLNKERLIPTNETDCFTYACSLLCQISLALCL